MANTINADASDQQLAVKLLHNEMAAWIKFLINDVEAKIGTEYSGVLKIPVRAQRFIDAKDSFDGKTFPGSLTKTLLQDNLGYADWSLANTADVDGLVAGAAAIRDAIELITDDFPESYASHKMVYVTATPAVQATLQALISAALDAYVLGRA